MRKFYEEYFHIPEHGKIREKVMLTRVALTVATMVLCLIAMSITAYAYFSHEASSGTHVIKAANFATKVGIQVQGPDDPPNVITSNYATHKVALEKGKEYTVTIEPLKTETAAKTGFVIVKADGCKNVYHTQQLYKDVAVPDGERTSICFKLTVTEDTTVYFLSHWGTSVHYADYQDKGKDDHLYITQDEVVTLEVAARDEGAAVQEEESTTTTKTTTTTATTTTTTTATTTTTTTVEVGEETTTTSSATTTTTTTTSAVVEEETTTTEATTVPTQPDATPTEAPAPEDTEE